jgi:hypothetical protein
LLNSASVCALTRLESPYLVALVDEVALGLGLADADAWGEALADAFGLALAEGDGVAPAVELALGEELAPGEAEADGVALAAV